MFSHPNYALGQRWLNHADPQLGLGIITAIEARRLEVNFPAADELRTFALELAPLTRITYAVGDEITTIDDQILEITQVIEKNDVVYYIGMDHQGQEHQIAETKLSPKIDFHSPMDRLFSGHLGRHQDYKLKVKTLNILDKLHHSEGRGLIGARTEHIPHQVYIANQVANRYAPRVLLADEVGLGKTIEAGLIMHHQLITGRAKRILILVPQTLIHQWFVEMLRRFNMAFSIFDEERYQTIEEDNPFETEQLILASIDFLIQNPSAAEMALVSNWDLVTVDEAHHLNTQSDESCMAYNCVEQFANHSKGLLLLTATPEQFGAECHFELLRLLDPVRFDCFDAFQSEQLNYNHINQLVEGLIQYSHTNENSQLPQQMLTEISALLGEQMPQTIDGIIAALIDQQGTGRVFFRNTRSAISGFPQRRVNTYSLATPECYLQLSTDDIELLLTPEQCLPTNTWLEQDPRVKWLIALIREFKHSKILVIAANASTAIALEKHIRLTTQIRVSSFHEGLSIIERDRAAAYFSDPEFGAECLICSEIGSEGRNFQFANQLVLFDLPLNPDLLEQRIGRLDRIGQQYDIDIHVPILAELPIAILFDWFDQAIGLFEYSCSFGSSIYHAFKDRLIALFRAPDPEVFAQLVKDTQQFITDRRQEIEAGRDRLLEISSCNEANALQLIESIETEEDPEVLQKYMSRVFNAYGVEHEPHSEFTEILRPSSHMKQPYFPGLLDDGMTVTYSRAKALVREDIEFLSFEHPMVRDVIDMVLQDNSGDAVFCSMSVKSLPPATLLFEAFYSVDLMAPEALALQQYLPTTPIRVLASQVGNNIAEVISHKQLSELCKILKHHKAHQLLSHVRPDVEAMAKSAHQYAADAMRNIQAEAYSKATQALQQEIKRNSALSQKNSKVAGQESQFLASQLELIQQAIQQAKLRLECVRIVINT